MGDYRSLFVNPRGSVDQVGDKDTADQSELIVGSRFITRNETRNHSSGSGDAQVVTSAFAGLIIDGDSTFDINSGSDVWQEAASGNAGNVLSWTGYKRTAAAISYSFRCAANAANQKVIQVAHVLSGVANGDPISPTDLAKRYHRVNTHIVSTGTLSTEYIAGTFIVPVDARMRTSGSQVMIAAAGTGVTITSSSLSVFEV